GAAEPASPLRPLEEDDGGPPARDVRGRTPGDGDRSPLPLLRPGTTAGPLALLPADPNGSPADLRRRERLLVMVLRGQHLPGGVARRARRACGRADVLGRRSPPVPGGGDRRYGGAPTRRGVRYGREPSPPARAGRRGAHHR